MQDIYQYQCSVVETIPGIFAATQCTTLKDLLRVRRNFRIVGASLTCMEIFGNGVRTDTSVIIPMAGSIAEVGSTPIPDSSKATSRTLIRKQDESIPRDSELRREHHGLIQFENGAGGQCRGRLYPVARKCGAVSFKPQRSVGSDSQKSYGLISPPMHRLMRNYGPRMGTTCFIAMRSS